ncbi:MAG: 3-phosphoserine/phosphohydroxythreonine transaminase [Saprospiraceae bacterium]
MKKHNFSSGPAILPQSVMEEAAKAIVDWNGIGLSVLEVSHRSKEFSAVMEEAQQLTKELLHIGDDYSVLFLTGGASSQFYMTAINLLNQDETACYIDTGNWSAKAINEGKVFGNIEVVASSKDRNYVYIPKEFVLPDNAKYLHITTNNTVQGTQFHQIPDVNIPLVADMSSDIFSRPIDIHKYGLIYAGAQKNMGPAGTTMVIVRKDLVGKLNRQIPTMLDYTTHVNKNSMFNTPPVFPVFVSMLTLRWLKAQGGVEAMEQINIAKAKMLYDEIDRNTCFRGRVDKADRSLMNVAFFAETPELEKAFYKVCEAESISRINGYRTIGGFRASIYNAMPTSSVEHLVHVMQQFEAQH